MTELNITNIEEIKTTSKVNEYVFTDAIAAATIIDGFTMAAFLAMPYVPILAVLGVSEALKASVTPGMYVAIEQNAKPLLEVGYTALSTTFLIVGSKTEAMFYTGLSAFSGFSTYVIRDYTREDFKEAGLEHYNGATGGSIKYTINELVPQLSSGKLLTTGFALKTAYKASLGARNNYLYEECSSNKECNDNPYDFIVRTETSEAAIDAAVTYGYNLVYSMYANTLKITFSSIPLKTLGGFIIGKTVGVMLKDIFLTNIESIHKISDVVCQEYPVLVEAKDQFSEFVNYATDKVVIVSQTASYYYNELDMTLVKDSFISYANSTMVGLSDLYNSYFDQNVTQTSGETLVADEL